MASLAFGPKGNRLITGNTDGVVRIHDAESAKILQHFEGYGDCDHTVAWAPQGDLVAAGCDDGTIRLWHADSEEPAKVLKGHEGWVSALRFTKDGARLLSSSHVSKRRLASVRSSGHLARRNSSSKYSFHQDTLRVLDLEAGCHGTHLREAQDHGVRRMVT